MISRSINKKKMSIFICNIERLTQTNTAYRRVLYTAEHQQLVAMSILPNDDIPFEIHPTHDQFVRIERGEGRLLIGPRQNETYRLTDGIVFIIPAGTYHRIFNTSSVHPLKLYTLYSPPQHAPDTFEQWKRQE